MNKFRTHINRREGDAARPYRRAVLLLLAVLLVVGVMRLSAQTIPSASGAMFVENAGQWPADVRYRLATDGMRIWLGARGVVVDLDDGAGNAYALGQQFVGARMPSPAASVPRPGVVNFGGGPVARTFGEVRYQDLYPGISVRYHGEGGRVKYDIDVAPGADASAIRISYRGASDVVVDPAGNLRVRTSVGELMEAAPYCYQDIDGVRSQVPCRFANHDGEITFSLGQYDRARPLVIDPVLIYSGYLGGARADSGRGVALDTSGNIYVAGITRSDDFPPDMIGGRRLNNAPDLFIVKLDPTGNTLLYSTYIAANGYDVPSAIRVRADGTVFVAGTTTSTNFTAAFPPRAVFDATANDVGKGDGFVMAVGPDGRPQFATYLGGSDTDRIEDMVIGARDGAVYVAGWTTSDAFPGATNTRRRLEDAFIAKLTPGLDRVVTARYLGSSGNDRATGIVAEDGGAYWISGWTDSADFRDDVARATFGPLGGRDCFAARVWFDGTGGAGEYAAIIGGAGADECRALAERDGVGLPDTVYLVGRTESSDFPATGSPGSWFAAKLVWPDGVLAYSQHIGPRDAGAAATVQAGTQGDALICGTTFGPDFPRTADSIGGTPRGGADLAFVRLDAAGNVASSSVIGGERDEIPYHQSALSAFGDLYVTGFTRSQQFPIRRGAHDSVLNRARTQPPDSTDAFLVRVGFTPHASMVAPLAIAFDTLRCDTIALYSFTVYNAGDRDLIIRRNAINRPYVIVEPDPAVSHTVPPGATLRYVIRFSSNAVGPFPETLFIDCNDPIRGGVFKIAVVAVRTVPVLQPILPRIVFDTVRACLGVPRDTTSRLATFSNGGASGFTVSSLALKNSRPEFSLGAFGLPRFVPVGINVSPMVRFHPRSIGTFRDTLLVSVLECDTVFKIPLEGSALAPSLSVQPPSITFDTLPPCNSSDDALVVITNNGPGTQHLTAAWATGGAEFSIVGSVPDSLASGESVSVLIRFTPKAGTGTVPGILRLGIRECDRTVDIPVSGTRSATTAIEASQTALDFGVIAGCAGEVLDSTVALVLHNPAATPITLDFPVPTGPFVLLDAPAPPYQLIGGESLTIHVRFQSNTDRGVFDGQLLIPYLTGGCDDTLRLSLHGSRQDVRLDASATNRDLGVIAACDRDVFDTLTLYNRSARTITVHEPGVVGSGAHVWPALPRDIAPGDSLRVAVRCSPRTSPDSVTLTYRWDPCNDSVVIRVRASKEGVRFDLSRDSIVFAPRLLCQGLPVADTVFVRNRGDSVPITIRSARIIGDTSFTHGNGDPAGTPIAPNTDAALPILFAPVVAGQHSAVLEVVVDPCGDTLRMPIAASAAEPTLAVTGAAFGDVAVNTRQVARVVLRNTSPLPLRLDSLANVPPPFAVLLSDLPIQLEPGDSATVTVEFAPLLPGEYSPTAFAVGSDPCTLMIPVQLNGRGTGSAALQDTLCLDGLVSGRVGDVVTIVLRLVSASRTMAPATVDYYFGYEASRLEFLEALALGGVVAADNRATGRLHVRQPEATALVPAQLALRFRLLGSRAPVAFVVADSVTIDQSARLALCNDSARIAISDRCVFVGATIGAFKNMLEPARPNPARTSVQVTYQQLEDARAVLRVYDLLGREVLRPLDAELPGGRYTVSFSVAELPTGLYYYTIEAGSYHQSRSMQVAR